MKINKSVVIILFAVFFVVSFIMQSKGYCDTMRDDLEVTIQKNSSKLPIGSITITNETSFQLVIGFGSTNKFKATIYQDEVKTIERKYIPQQAKTNFLLLVIEMYQNRRGASFVLEEPSSVIRTSIPYNPDSPARVISIRPPSKFKVL